MEKNEYTKMNEIEDFHWWFVGKGILIDNVCKYFLRLLPANRRLLDLGCGTGAIIGKLERYGEPHGIEISPEAIEYLKEKNIQNIILSDANKPIPYKNNTFSLITCLDVLEHVDNDIDLIYEMFRVCAPGGYIVVTVPGFSILWSYHDEALHHKRRYSKKRLIQILGKLDGKIIKSSYYNFIFFLPILIFRNIRKIIRGKDREISSDCHVVIPPQVNKLFSLIHRIEIWCLRFINFPLGVSLLFILQKPGNNEER